VPKTQPHPALKALGRRIRSHRANRGLSQEALADAAGIDRSYMSGIERGIRNTSVLMTLRIAKALSISPASLFDDESR
jgi:transcriptional regulator with XRE-family HTH domain